MGALRLRLLPHDALPLHDSPEAVGRARTLLVPADSDSDTVGGGTGTRHVTQRLFQKQTALGRDGTAGDFASHQRVARTLSHGARNPADLQHPSRLYRETVAHPRLVARDAPRHLFLCHRYRLVTNAGGVVQPLVLLPLFQTSIHHYERERVEH